MLINSDTNVKKLEAMLKTCSRCGEKETLELEVRDNMIVGAYAECPNNHYARVLHIGGAAAAAMG